MLVILFGALFLALPILGTTIVLIRTPDQVVVAADSVGTFVAPGGMTKVESVCKVYQIEEQYFVVGNFVNDARNGFGVPVLVRNAWRKGDGAQKNVEAARDAILAEFRSRPLYAREIVQESNKTKYPPDNVITTVVFFGLHEKIPFVRGWAFELNQESGEITATEDACPGPNCPNGVRLFWVGQHANIQKLVAGGFRGAPVDTARSLVQAEIDNHAPGVGGPIDIIEISTGGSRWVQKKESCPIVLN